MASPSQVGRRALVGASRVEALLRNGPTFHLTRTLLVERRVRPHSLAPSFRYLTRARRRGARLYSGLRQSFRGIHSRGDKQSVTMLLTAKIGATTPAALLRAMKSRSHLVMKATFQRAGRS